MFTSSTFSTRRKSRLVDPAFEFLFLGKALNRGRGGGILRLKKIN